MMMIYIMIYMYYIYILLRLRSLLIQIYFCKTHTVSGRPPDRSIVFAFSALFMTRNAALFITLQHFMFLYSQLFVNRLISLEVTRDLIIIVNTFVTNLYFISIFIDNIITMMIISKCESSIV